MCDHAKQMLGRLRRMDAMLNKEVTELKAKLEIEAIRYEMQLKVSKIKSNFGIFPGYFLLSL